MGQTPCQVVFFKTLQNTISTGTRKTLMHIRSSFWFLQFCLQTFPSLEITIVKHLWKKTASTHTFTNPFTTTTAGRAFLLLLLWFFTFFPRSPGAVVQRRKHWKPNCCQSNAGSSIPDFRVRFAITDQKRSKLPDPTNQLKNQRTRHFFLRLFCIFPSSLAYQLCLCLTVFVVRAAEAVKRGVEASQQSYWSPLPAHTVLPPPPLTLLLSLSPSVQASLCFWQLPLTIVDVTANFCENWHIWLLKCHMPYRIFFGCFPHLYNRWIGYKSGSLLIHSFLFLLPCSVSPLVFLFYPFFSQLLFKPFDVIDTDD